MSIDFTIRPGPGNEAPIFHSKFGGHLYYWIMSSEPSIIGLLAEQAEKFYEKKDWTRAVQKFEAYFQKAYPEMDKGDQEMSLEDTRRLMRYADALFQMVQNQARENNKFDEDELDTVLLYVRSAQKTFEKYKDQVNAQEVTDTHRLLAEIARALGIALSELFEGIAAAERKEWILIHPEDQKDLEREENHGLRYRMIFETPLDAANLQVMLVTEGDGKQQERVITEADQLLYILSGEFYYCIGEEKILLRAGDLLFFDGTLAHGPAYEPGTRFSLLAFYFLHTGKDPNESWRSIR